jgi:hypothetical protein
MIRGVQLTSKSVTTVITNDKNDTFMTYVKNPTELTIDCQQGHLIVSVEQLEKLIKNL